MQSASFSPDGHRAVSAGEDGTVRIWDLDAERLLRTVPGHKGLVYQAVFAPDGATDRQRRRGRNRSRA